MSKRKLNGTLTTTINVDKTLDKGELLPLVPNYLVLKDERLQYKITQHIYYLYGLKTHD